MFILKSFFAEPAAIFRPFGNGSATGRVLALITAMAGAVLMALQPVQAQEADFRATLYETRYPDKSGGNTGTQTGDVIILAFKPNLGSGRAAVGPSTSSYKTFIFTSKFAGITDLVDGDLTDRATTHYTADDRPNLRPPSVSTATSAGAADVSAALAADTDEIALLLDSAHSFKAGDILTFVSAKLASDGNSIDEADAKQQFTVSLEEFDWGADHLYSLGIPSMNAGDSTVEYSLAGVPGGTDGIGDVSYSFTSGSRINNVDFLNHISGRNVLRVSGATEIPATTQGSCNGHYCLDGYTAIDGNGAQIMREVSVFIVERLDPDDIDSGIPTLQQQVEGGVVVYAKEMFGADSSNLVLMRGKHGEISFGSDGITPTSKDDEGYFVLQFRKPVDTENSGEITLNLHGAAFGDVMAPSHVSVRNGGDNQEIGNAAVQRIQGGNVGDNQVVFRVSSGSTAPIKIGDYIRFEIPALMGTGLGDDEMVFISASVASATKSGNNYFPDGANGVSKCRSERIQGARECIYAKAAQAVDLEVKGYTERAKINVNDRTRAAGAGGNTPNKSVVLTPDAVSGLRANKSANVFDLGMANISLVYSTEIQIRKRDHESWPPTGRDPVPILNAAGEIFAANSVSPNDFFHLRVSPTPSHGALVAATVTGSSYEGLKAVQQAAYQGRLKDVMDLSSGSGGKKTLVKSLLYVPSGAIDSTGATPLEHGEIYNMTASVDFNNASYEDMTSNPNTTLFELSAVQSMAVAYAIPPPSSPDDAFIRIRCEQDAGCDVSLRCSNQTGATWFGELSGRINGKATEVLTAEEIADILSGEGFDATRHWGGPSNGRLSCEVMTRGGDVSTQVLVRSGGILTNNTNISMGTP